MKGLTIMSKYMSKPVVIDASVYEQGMEDGLVVTLVDLKNEEYTEKVFSGKNYMKSYMKLLERVSHNKHLAVELPTRPYINTIEGRKFISKGDYIITGTLGERYLCHPDIFKEYYEPVDEK